jgi:hypothetical protein
MIDNHSSQKKLEPAKKEEEKPEVIAKIMLSLEKRRLKRERDRNIDSHIYSDLSTMQSPFDRSRMTLRLQPFSAEASG